MDTPLSPPTYRDRRTGLIIFGIIEIIIGCFCLLFAPLVVLGQMMAAKSTGHPPEYKMIVPSLVLYPAVAVGFIWLGIGSMLRRRWARALSLIVSWSWLLIGLVSLVMFFVMAPTIFAAAMSGPQPLPPEARIVMMIVGGLTLGLLFVALPGALVLFYRSPHVKATCEAADPQRRWTDACPLPVLAASLWLFVGALWMPLMPIAYNSVLPVFGVLVHGMVGTLAFVALAVLWLYVAWALYRLKPIGWWLALITIGLMMISNAITFSTIDIMEMYRAMGYSDEMLKQIQQFKISSRQILFCSFFGTALMVGYFLFIYRYFRTPRQSEAQPSPPTA